MVISPRCSVVQFSLLLLCVLVEVSYAVRVRGTWNSAKSRFQVVTKFGFQQTNKLEPKITRGYIYGNITAKGYKNDMDPLLFTIVSQKDIDSFDSHSQYTPSCGSLLQNLSRKGFESRCMKDGPADIFRWIPCPEGKLCKEEDDPSIVISGYQLTMQIEEPTTAEYWYVVMLSCHLDDNCTWTSSETSLSVNYDIWLTNGHPNAPHANPFTLQFSFDEQDATQMYLITLVSYMVLCGILLHGFDLKISSRTSFPLRVLSWIIYMKTTAFSLQSFNMIIFSIDGEGFLLARLFGEIFRMAATDLVCLVLILLARGWCLSPFSRAISAYSIVLWTALTITHFIFYICNFIFIYDIVHDIDIFTSWPGYGMLFVRIIFALWFLVEVRVLIRREQNEEKAVFLAHFGAGFLVWFVYLPGLGVIASFISLLWRFKIILGITALANFCAICCLLHLFWPTSQNRKFFGASNSYHRRADRTDSTELADFERLLYEDSEEDSEPINNSNSQSLLMHSI